MAGLREFFESSKGKLIALIAGVVLLVVLFFVIWSNLGSEATEIARDRMYIDATTGKAFEHTLKASDVMPIKAPSGQNSGYPAELCYWTADGKIKDKPTPVLLNSYVGKPGPTFCPDCGRVVVMHNPAPLTGTKPPPTKAEWDARGNRGGADQADGR